MGNHKRSRWERFKEYMQRSVLTNWIVAIFTIVLACSAIYQFVIMSGQLNVMRVDQRAWLKVEAVPAKSGDDSVSLQLSSGQPVTYPLHVVNTGKTPARNIDMQIFVDIVDADQEPPLSHVEESSDYPHGRITAGIIFPSSDLKQVVTRPSHGATPQLATDDEIKNIKDGKAYLAVYGIINYDDVFKTHHWTRFCTWIALNGNFQASECTKYNAVDNN